MVVAVSLYHESNVLADAMDVPDDVRLDVPCITGREDGTVSILVFVTGPGRSRFRQNLSDDPTTAQYTALGTTENGDTYHITYTGETIDNEIYHHGVNNGAVFLSTRRTNERSVTGGYLWMLFPDKERLGSFCDYCEESGFRVEPHRVYDRSPTAANPGLSESQREVLRVADEIGYFEVPREATMDDIAQEVDISQQAVSEHIRRGVGHLVDDTLNNRFVNPLSWQL